MWWGTGCRVINCRVLSPFPSGGRLDRAVMDCQNSPLSPSRRGSFNKVELIHYREPGWATSVQESVWGVE